MNEFTKEELIEILNVLEDSWGPNGIKDSSVGIKIQSMIDNDCEHENMFYCSGEFSQCDKCGHRE